MFRTLLVDDDFLVRSYLKTLNAWEKAGYEVVKDVQDGEEALAARIAPEILRFHILAESNAAHDQELKIGLKGLVLDYVHSQVRTAPARKD